MRLALAAATLALASSPLGALEPLPKGVDIVEKLGETVPRDLLFTDENGAQRRLADYLGDGRPLLLNLVYFECPMLCTLTLNGLVGALRQQAWKPGKEFRVLTVSFDPKDTPAGAAKKQRNYFGSLGYTPGKDAWPFLTGDASNIAALTDAVGFGYRWDAEKKSWDHTAALIALTPEGKVSRYLYGVQYPPQNVKLALFEAAAGKVGTALERALLRCYAYDASTKSYRVFAVRFMRAGGLLVLGMLVTFLTIMWRRDLRRSQSEKEARV